MAGVVARLDAPPKLKGESEKRGKEESPGLAQPGFYHCALKLNILVPVVDAPPGAAWRPLKMGPDEGPGVPAPNICCP